MKKDKALSFPHHTHSPWDRMEMLGARGSGDKIKGENRVRKLVKARKGILAASCLLGLQAHWKAGIQAGWCLLHEL